MLELGKVQHAAQSARILKPPRDEMPDSKQKTATIKIADDDAAVAVIRNPRQIEDLKKDNQYPDYPLSAGRLNKNKSWSKAITAASETSRYHVYADPSELRIKLASEIRAINSFDGFLLGVHDKIEEFPEHIEFNLEQVQDVEQRVGELYETLELYKFTLKQIRAEALKVLKCQGNLGPRRVLLLLKETIAEQNVDGQDKEQQ